MDPTWDTGFHFNNLNVEQYISKGKEVQNCKIINNEKKAVSLFQEYIGSLGLKDTYFYNFTEDELDHYLNTF